MASAGLTTNLIKRKRSDVMKTNKTKKQLFDFLNSKAFAIAVLRNIEENVHLNFMSIRNMLASRDISTLMRWAEHIEEEKRQRTTTVSVRFAYDFEAAVWKALEAAGFALFSKDAAASTARCDVRVETVDAGIIPFEIKTTQGKDAWTGATHSEEAGKVDNYILISYELDYSTRIPTLDEVITGQDFTGVIKAAHFAVTSPTEDGEPIIKWLGKATKSNSATTGKIPLEKAGEYVNHVVIGDVLVTKQMKKWCRPVRVSLDGYRNASGTLVSGNESQPAQLPLMARVHNFSETAGVRA